MTSALKQHVYCLLRFCFCPTRPFSKVYLGPMRPRLVRDLSAFHVGWGTHTASLPGWVWSGGLIGADCFAALWQSVSGATGILEAVYVSRIVLRHMPPYPFTLVPALGWRQEGLEGKISDELFLRRLVRRDSGNSGETATDFAWPRRNHRLPPLPPARNDALEREGLEQAVSMAADIQKPLHISHRARHRPLPPLPWSQSCAEGGFREKILDNLLLWKDHERFWHQQQYDVYTRCNHHGRRQEHSHQKRKITCRHGIPGLRSDARTVRGVNNINNISLLSPITRSPVHIEIAHTNPLEITTLQISSSRHRPRS